jgi:lactate dehydrogenase-like 2-hydroxyacid dehydrogenase
MKIAFFSTKKYDEDSFQSLENTKNHEFNFLDPRLDQTTASLAAGHEAVCIFVNDEANAEVLDMLAENGVKYIGLRCAGFNNVDLKKAKELGISVVRVPAYSPEAVAEFAVGMILVLVRKYHKAFNRVREGNFVLDGLVGINLYQKTVGLIGTGNIGILVGKILARGFSANVIAFDPKRNEEAAKENGIKYVDTLDELLGTSDIISLHCPLMNSTRHIINDDNLKKTKKGVILVNTSRGGLVDTDALIRALKSGHLGAVGLDVYERESEFFFKDSSTQVIQDDVLSRLLTFYNVFVSGHQAFLTEEALRAIAQTTLNNLEELEAGKECKNTVKP